MGIFFETLILYFVLFLSGSAGLIINNSDAAAGYSIISTLNRLLFYSIPALALIWYLLLKVKPLKDWKIRPGKNDLISGLITLPCLLIIGFATVFISRYIDDSSSPISIYSPSTGIEWAVLSVSFMAAAYLEETFFRFYLLSRRDELKLKAAPALAVSVLLFSVCHIYEGPWGFLNAAISATVLGFVFLRYKALHGIAIAHGMYNIAVYIINDHFTLFAMPGKF